METINLWECMVLLEKYPWATSLIKVATKPEVTVLKSYLYIERHKEIHVKGVDKDLKE